MSTRSLTAVVMVLIAVTGYTRSVAQETPNLGRPATSGRDRWVGHQHPARWHGAAAREWHTRAGRRRLRPEMPGVSRREGRRATNDRLVGGQGTLTSANPVRTIGSYWPYATTVFDYVRRAMPYTQSQSLTNDEVYAVTAYLLHLNGIIRAQDVMNAQTCHRCRCRTVSTLSSLTRLRGRSTGNTGGSRLARKRRPSCIALPIISPFSRGSHGKQRALEAIRACAS